MSPHLRIRRRSHPRRLMAGPLDLITIAGITVLVLIAIFGPMIWGDRANAGDIASISAKPSSEHWFGTDAAGRDVLARTLVATRLSLAMALSATAIGVTCGIVLGLLPTVLPRRGARFVSAATGFALAFPALLLMIVLSIVLNAGSLGAVLAIGLAIVPSFARLTQTLGASIAGRDFVLAARILGVSRLRIMLTHVLPNVRNPLIVNASIMAGGALLSFAGLSYLGIGVQAPAFDWGRLLNDGLTRIYVNPATALAPAAAVMLSGMMFILLGDFLARGLGVASPLARRSYEAPPSSSAPDQDEDGSADLEIDQVLSVKDLRVLVPTSEGHRHAVDGVSFFIARGEVVGLVGESGSGKSLTCMAIAGLLEAPLAVSADSLRFDGTELARHGAVSEFPPSAAVARQLGTRMAFVFQDPSTSLNPSIHVGAQVSEIGHIHEGLSRQDAMRRAIDRLASVRIPDPERRARQLPHQFSGGMRQRAMIASGLMGNPALIIADEPTTALDVTVQREVLSVVKEVNERENAAILLVSHDLAVVTSLCTRVLVMYAGRIVEDISTDDLLAGRTRHPYTEALMAVIPDMDASPKERFATIAEGTDFSAHTERVLS